MQHFTNILLTKEVKCVTWRHVNSIKNILSSVNIEIEWGNREKNGERVNRKRLQNMIDNDGVCTEIDDPIMNEQVYDTQQAQCHRHT